MSPSQSLRDALHAAVEALEALGIPYALCGGAAMPAWRHERGTRDADFLIAVEPADPGRFTQLVESARQRGFAHLDRADRRKLEGCLLLHLWYPLRDVGLSLRVDLMTAGGEFQRGVVERAVSRSVMGRAVQVATCEDLILLKLLAGRPIDLLDAKSLVQYNRADLDLAALRERARSLALEAALTEILGPS